MMKTGKVLIAGVVVTVFNIIIGMVTCGGVFNWVYTLEPTNVWRPMGGSGPGMGYLLGCLLLNIILAFAYALIQKGIPGKNRLIKGIVFGLIVWAVGMLPGMWATYTFMTVATTVVVYWTVLALIVTPITGMIISVIYGE